MSKKTRQKVQSPKLEPAPSVTAPPPSFRSLFRRHGFLIAGGLFLLANLLLRLMDTKTLESTAFPLIVALTGLSIVLAILAGWQLFQVSKRAQVEGWTKADWERWRNGEK